MSGELVDPVGDTHTGGPATPTPPAPAPVDRTPRVSQLRAELEAQRAPLVEERDAVRARLDELTQSEECNTLRKRMKELNALIGPIDNDLAAISRVSKGNRSIQIEGGTLNRS